MQQLYQNIRSRRRQRGMTQQRPTAGRFRRLSSKGDRPAHPCRRGICAGCQTRATRHRIRATSGFGRITATGRASASGIRQKNCSAARCCPHNCCSCFIKQICCRVYPLRIILLLAVANAYYHCMIIARLRFRLLGKCKQSLTALL